MNIFCVFCSRWSGLSWEIYWRKYFCLDVLLYYFQSFDERLSARLWKHIFAEQFYEMVPNCQLKKKSQSENWHISLAVNFTSVFIHYEFNVFASPLAQQTLLTHSLFNIFFLPQFHLRLGNGTAKELEDAEILNIQKCDFKKIEKRIFPDRRNNSVGREFLCMWILNLKRYFWLTLVGNENVFLKPAK